MTKGSCNPGVGQHNETTLGSADSVLLDVVWDWDGTSVYPNCDGPVVSVRTVNTTAGTTYYAHLPQKVRGGTVVTIAPGTDTTLTGNQLRQAGLDTYGVILGVVIDQNPT